MLGSRDLHAVAVQEAAGLAKEALMRTRNSVALVRDGHGFQEPLGVQREALTAFDEQAGLFQHGCLQQGSAFVEEVPLPLLVEDREEALVQVAVVLGADPVQCDQVP